MSTVAAPPVGPGTASVVEDEDLAVGSPSTTLLITAPHEADVAALGRRIHLAGARAAFPFVHVHGASLPTEAAGFSTLCGRLLDAARGGSLLLTEIEQMPAAVQDAFSHLLVEQENARGQVRVMTGTTASLWNGVAAGTFSERLFYQLNVLHLVATDHV